MNGRNRYTDTFDKTDYNNRWYRWLAVASLVLALGIYLTIFCNSPLTKLGGGGATTGTPSASYLAIYARLGGIGITVFFRIHASSMATSNLTSRPTFTCGIRRWLTDRINGMHG